MLKTKKSPSRKKIVAIIAIILASLVLSFGAYAVSTGLFQSDTTPDSSKTSSDSDTSLPSNIDEPYKEDNIQVDTPKTDTPSSTVRSLIVTESDVIENVVEVRAYVSDLSEDGGTCSITFTKTGETSVTTRSPSFGDASTTQCGALNTPVGEFSAKGTWSFTITYTSTRNSASASGSVTI